MRTWNVASVREELPNIRVMDKSGAVHDAMLLGRRLPFAQVVVHIPAWGNVTVGEWPWISIADALNHNRTLKV